MNKLINLSPGDKLITQNTETHKYELHTVTGNTDTSAILNGGTQILWAAENVKEDGTREVVYTLQSILMSYDEDRNDRHWDEEHPNSQPVNLIRLFHKGSEAREAHDYLKTLNTLQRVLTPYAYEHGTYARVGSRVYETDTEEMAQARINPHTLTRQVAKNLHDVLVKEVDAVTATYLQNVEALRQNMRTLFTENHDKLKAYYDKYTPEEAKATGTVHILRNKHYHITRFGFITGSLVTFELGNWEGDYTLQVANGSLYDIDLVDADGNPAGKFTTTCEHIDHEHDGLPLEDLYGDYDEYNVCYSCAEPDRIRTELIYTPEGGKPHHVISYNIKLNTTFEQEKARNKLRAWQMTSLRTVARRYNNLTTGTVESHLTPLYLAALDLYPSDTKTLDVIENVVKSVNKRLHGAGDKALTAKHELVTNVQKTLAHYLTIKDTGVAL